MKIPVILFSTLLITGQVLAQSADTLTLESAVRLAIQQSPAVAQAESAIQAAQARTRQIESYVKPSLEADASYTRIDPVVKVTFPINGTPTELAFAPNNVYQAGLTINEPIYAFGREGASLDLAHSGEKQAEDNVEQFRAAAAYQTVQAYYGLVSTDEAIRIEQEQLKLLKENLGISQERQHAGTATTLDPLNIQVRIATVESQLADLRSSRARVAAGLRRLIGYAPGAAIHVHAPENMQKEALTLDSLESLATLRRTEVQVAKDAEESARLQVEVQRTSNNPLLLASVSGGAKDGYLPNLNDPKLNWAGTIGLKVPILDGGRTHAMVDEAEANYHAAQSHTLDVERGIASEVEQSLADVESAKTRLGLISTQIAQAREAYDIALLRYKSGAATNLDVLSAANALEQANLQQAQLTYTYELNQVSLERATGGRLW